MKTKKLTLDSIKIQSFITQLSSKENITVKGGSSWDTDFEFCEEIFPKPFHLDENEMP